MVTSKRCVVIPVYNSRDKLKVLLRHLKSLGREVPLENVIIVDDGSQDGTDEMLSGAFPAVRRLKGDGNLLWTGAIRKGMQYAIEEGFDFIFWLNHDCFPMAGSFDRICHVLQSGQAACVSGWCFIQGHPESPVNPGFRDFKEIPTRELEEGKLIFTDGVNGNFVGFSSREVARLDLPDSVRYPHYGDGPYTLRLSRSRLKVAVCPQARAALGYEVERRMPPFWRVLVGRKSGLAWFRYFFFSFRSPFHWQYRMNEARYYFGTVGAISYLRKAGIISGQILLASALRLLISRNKRLSMCLRHFSTRWPSKKLAEELAEL